MNYEALTQWVGMSIIFHNLIAIPFKPQEIEFICLKIQLFIYNTEEFANCFLVNILHLIKKKKRE